MKRYEGLFILNTTAKEEGIKDTIDKISAEINASGGKVETVQKMDKKFNSGFYVNIIFETNPNALAQLRHRFTLNEEVFRVLFTVAPEPKNEEAPKLATQSK